MKTEISSMFFLIPVYFIVASICLSIFAKKITVNKKILSKILIFRFAVVLCGILVLFIGLILDKNNILSLMLLFVLYYIVFSVFETQAMLRISKNHQELKK